MQTLTINFFTSDDGIKAVVYEDTNKYLFQVEGTTVYECLDKAGQRYQDRKIVGLVSSNLNRRD